MPVDNIVIGQKVSRELQERAKELRRSMTPAEKILWEKLRHNRLNGLQFRQFGPNPLPLPCKGRGVPIPVSGRG